MSFFLNQPKCKKLTIAEYVATSGATPQIYTQARDIQRHVFNFNVQNRKWMEYNIKHEQLTLIQKNFTFTNAKFKTQTGISRNLIQLIKS